jgi:hypothetical protein
MFDADTHSKSLVLAVNINLFETVEMIIALIDTIK